MTSGDIPVLTRLSDSRQAITAPEDDVRGRTVTDRSGNELGKVGDLLVDEAEHKVRFLLLEHGGFLGIGEKKSYVPVDAVAEVTEDRIRIDRTRQQVADAPEYDPEIVDRSEFYDRVYRHYGYAPFWGTGYVYPPYPRLPGQP
ncbi:MULTISPECIES: PRC-barrel domain-containing protein [unclassified Streptomyces]|uniref:PRC-barrel domain-containing protein n=1 Tax=unclassified Streptomyces TaxID=2593676 RepID=UPI0016620003|nr:MULTISPECIES: PRC-barrel domain-containing protein [unclassified Streptomyces]MBD0841431.1 PRC-barrel domain-containing protein [Streptomyces sp. TRM68416]